MSSTVRLHAGRWLHRLGFAVLLASASACNTDAPTAPSPTPAAPSPTKPTPRPSTPTAPGSAKLTLSRADVVFNARAGTALADSANVTITASSGETLSELVAVPAFSSGSPDGWLTVELDQGAVPVKLTLRAHAASLPPGEYTAVVRLRAPRVEADSLLVTTRVLSGAGIGLNAAKICFTMTFGDVAPKKDDVRVTSVDGSAIDGLTATIVYDPGLPTGWLDASFDVTTAPARLWLRGTPGSLPAGVYGATVNVASPKAGNSPVPIRVTMTINQPRLSRLFVHIEWEDPQNGGLATIWGTNGIHCQGGEFGCVGYLENGVGDLSLTPDADYGAQFRHWTGACTGSDICTVHFTTPGIDQQVTAVYGARPTYVTLGLRGNRASGTVTVSPPVTMTGTGGPMTCRLENGVAPPCQGQLVTGAGTFTVTAKPDPGSLFVFWQLGGLSGDRSQLPSCAPTTPSCTFTLTMNGNYVDGLVTFASTSDRSLEIQVQGQGFVSWSYPPGGDCPEICKQYFEPGASVTLRANPAEGMTFAGWTDCPSPAGTSCTVPMTVDRVIGARFAPPPPAVEWELVLDLSGKAGWGFVTLQSTAGNRPDFCSWNGTFATGPCSMNFPWTVQEVRLTAQAADGSRFGGWLPVFCQASGAECVVKAPTGGASVVTVAGQFLSLLPPSFLVVASLGEGASGLVQGRIPGTNPDSSVALACRLTNGITSGQCEVYTIPGTIELIAVPAAGSRFTGWDRGCSGADLHCFVTLRGDETTYVSAMFAPLN